MNFGKFALEPSDLALCHLQVTNGLVLLPAILLKAKNVIATY